MRNRYPVAVEDLKPLLDQCNEDEYLAESARRAMDDYRGFVLAMPTPEHEQIRKAMMRTKIMELVRGTGRNHSS